MTIVLLLFSPFSARFQVQLNEHGSLERVVVRSLRVDRSRLSCSPCLITTIAIILNFGALGRRFDPESPCISRL